MAETKNAGILRDAMNKTIGSDKKAIITVLGSLTNARVLPLTSAFNQTYSRSLHHDIKNKLSGDFEDLAIALLTDVDEFDAKQVRKAMAGRNNNDVMAEILCTRTDAEMKAISVAYQRMYSQDLKSRISSEIKMRGNLRNAYLCGFGEPRASLSSIAGQLPAQVEALYRAGEAKFGTDKKTFVRILGGNTREANLALAQAYLKSHGKELVRVIKSEFSGDLETALLAMVTPLDMYFAQRFFKALDALNTDEAAVIRLIRSRKGKDLPAISVALATLKKNRPLMQWVVEKTSGNFKRLLVCLCANFAGQQALG